MAEIPKKEATITLTQEQLSDLVARTVQAELGKLAAPVVPSAPGAPGAAAQLLANNLQLSQLAAVMKQSSDAEFQAQYEQRLKEAEAEMSQGVQARTQRVCDTTYPKRDGDTIWRVKLEDRNGQPELTVPGLTKEDAKARYENVCGITSVTDRKSKWVIEPAGKVVQGKNV